MKLTLIMAFLVTVFSCKKEVPLSAQNMSRNTLVVDSLPVTTEDRELVNNLDKMTSVLKELYHDNSNLKIVNAAIYAHAYTDESILVRDLIYPGQSRLAGNLLFENFMQKWNLRLEKFTENFWREVSKMNDPNFTRFLNGLEKTGSSGAAGARVNEYGQEITIYFPYSEETLPNPEGSYSPITSIVTATADADQGIGYQPHYEGGVLQYYKEIFVDDEYAFNNPTQIIGVNGVEPYNPPLATNSAFPPGGPIHLPGLPREVKQVYVGDIKLHAHQYDKLISFTGNGGGSEIRFTRADGFLKVEDGQVVTANVYFTQAKVVSRNDVRNRVWVNMSYEWDGDWEQDNLQQNIGIYEEDNRNSSTFNGSLSTTITASLTPITITTVRTLGFSINYKSDDELITQKNLNRDVFFILNRTDLENEMYNGWPVRDKDGPVSYTLNDRTFY